MFPYGGYDPFLASSSQAVTQNVSAPGRPPFPMMHPMPQHFNHSYVQNMPSMMQTHGFPPHPMMMHGMQNMQQNGIQKQNQSQGNGFNLGTAVGGANQLMGLAQQVGNILSFFK
jgi:hypothetical protein